MKRRISSSSPRPVMLSKGVWGGPTEGEGVSWGCFVVCESWVARLSWRASRVRTLIPRYSMRGRALGGRWGDLLRGMVVRLFMQKSERGGASSAYRDAPSLCLWLRRGCRSREGLEPATWRFAAFIGTGG
jgi:hypothetical protein